MAPPAAEADAAVEHVVAAAAVSLGRLVFVEQRVDEQLDGALVLALDRVADGCEERGGGGVVTKTAR